MRLYVLDSVGMLIEANGGMAEPWVRARFG